MCPVPPLTLSCVSDLIFVMGFVERDGETEVAGGELHSDGRGDNEKLCHSAGHLIST